MLFFLEFTLKSKNNQPKYSADCFLDSDNLNFFYIIECFVIPPHQSEASCWQVRGSILRTGRGEAVDAVTGILHAFRIVQLKSVVPKHCLNCILRKFFIYF